MQKLLTPPEVIAVQCQTRNSDGDQGEQPFGQHARPAYARRYWLGSASLEVAVFSKLVQSQNGAFQTYNLLAKRTYKDGDDYKDAKGFRGEDLPFLIQAITQAYSWISEQQNA